MHLYQRNGKNWAEMYRFSCNYWISLCTVWISDLCNFSYRCLVEAYLLLSSNWNYNDSDDNSDQNNYFLHTESALTPYITRIPKQLWTLIIRKVNPGQLCSYFCLVKQFGFQSHGCYLEMDFMRYGASRTAEHILRPLPQMFFRWAGRNSLTDNNNGDGSGEGRRSSDRLRGDTNKRMTKSLRISSFSWLPLPPSLPLLHRRPHYGALWRLAKTPPLKMKEQLVSETIIVCVVWHSAGTIISHHVSAHRWTRKIWSCKHSWGTQKEHARRTAMPSMVGAAIPISAECLFKSLHKTGLMRIPMFAIVFFFFPFCVIKNTMHAMHARNTLIADEPYSLNGELPLFHQRLNMKCASGNVWAQMSLKCTRKSKLDKSASLLHNMSEIQSSKWIPLKA